ncbi:hypothetical protein Hdeb2414_s0003g00089961 [Helianthus debilis subsp. tardiflorus]
MRLFWRMDREDKPVYMEDGKGKLSLYTLLHLRERVERWPLFRKGLMRSFSIYKLLIILFFRKMKIWPRNPQMALGLAPVVVKKPKAEPRDAADVPVSTPNDPIDLESSPERLLKTRAGKRK